MSEIRSWLQKSVPLLLGIGLVVLLLMRIEVATQRFFDVDEFTHMHWAAEIFMGEKPYVDFFTFFPPGYHWLLQPLFVFFGNSPSIFIAGRFLSVLAFAGILIITAIFFARLRSVHYALLPVFILAFLPMPYDKYFEIRPDTWSTFLGFAGTLLLSMGWRRVGASKIVASSQGLGNRSKRVGVIFFGAGLLFSICLLVLPKMLPFVMVAVGIEFLRTVFAVWNNRKSLLLRHPGEGRDPSLPLEVLRGLRFRDMDSRRSQTRQERLTFRLRGNDIFKILSPFLWMTLGGCVIAGIFFLWMLSLGNFKEVWYSLTKEGVEANQIGNFFIMEPHLFFFPNSSFYGGEGITLSYIVNHSLWFLAFVVGSIRLFIPVITSRNNKTTILDELLLAGIFFVSLYGYIYYFPLKHTQYLIPIGVFIALYAADGMVVLFNKIGVAGPVLLIGLILTGIAVNKELNNRKLWYKNTDQLKEVTLLQQTVPKDAVVLDLEGKMLTWKNGYYVCCLAFGQFQGYLSHPLPGLPESMTKNNITYVYAGDSGRIPTLPNDAQWYLTKFFAPVPGWNDKLWKRK